MSHTCPLSTVCSCTFCTIQFFRHPPSLSLVYVYRASVTHVLFLSCRLRSTSSLIACPSTYPRVSHPRCLSMLPCLVLSHLSVRNKTCPGPPCMDLGDLACLTTARLSSWRKIDSILYSIYEERKKTLAL